LRRLSRHVIHSPSSDETFFGHSPIRQSTIRKQAPRDLRECGRGVRAATKAPSNSSFDETDVNARRDSRLVLSDRVKGHSPDPQSLKRVPSPKEQLACYRYGQRVHTLGIRL
jgi:hypothetical protein